MASMNATAPEVHVKSVRDKLENVVVTSSVALAMLLLLGHVARAKLLWLRALHLPSSLIGGLIGWVIFAFVDLFGGGATELVDDWFSAGWGVLPGFCTDIVFSCLFLGTPVPRAREVLQSPRREHLMYGLIVVFGQFAVSSIITGIVQIGDESLPAAFATVIP